jgi:hypothetical protein
MLADIIRYPLCRHRQHPSAAQPQRVIDEIGHALNCSKAICPIMARLLFSTWGVVKKKKLREFRFANFFKVGRLLASFPVVFDLQRNPIDDGMTHVFGAGVRPCV